MVRVGCRQPAVIEPHDPIRHVEIPVVVADHEHRFAACAVRATVACKTRF